jgi:hypothetical protein
MRRSDLGKRLIKPSAKAAAARDSERMSLVIDTLTSESSDESVVEQVVKASSNDSVSVLHDPDFDERLLHRVNLPPEPVEFEVVTEEREKEPIFQTKLSLNEIEHGQKHADDLLRIWDNLKPIISHREKTLHYLVKNCINFTQSVNFYHKMVKNYTMCKILPDYGKNLHREKDFADRRNLYPLNYPDTSAYQVYFATWRFT